MSCALDCHTEVATDGVREGESGCLFDEIQISSNRPKDRPGVSNIVANAPTRTSGLIRERNRIAYRDGAGWVVLPNGRTQRRNVLEWIERLLRRGEWVAWGEHQQPSFAQTSDEYKAIECVTLGLPSLRREILQRRRHRRE